MNFFRGLLKAQPVAKNPTDIALICNHTACVLGHNFHTQFSKHVQTVGVAHSQGDFEAFLNEETDRERLVAYLKHNNMSVKYLVFN